MLDETSIKRVFDIMVTEDDASLLFDHELIAKLNGIDLTWISQEELVTWVVVARRRFGVEHASFLRLYDGLRRRMEDEIETVMRALMDL